MIFFKTLKFKNFLSTGNYFTEINLCRNTNTLVVGSNGAGKSTMLDALCFVLFGKAFRNINKPQLVNSINQKDCLVECNFSIGNKDFRIVRGMKPNVFEIYIDGDLLNQDAASKDYQEHLEKVILKLNYKSFTQIVILGSASFTPFMQLSAADRRAIIEDLLDIQIFSTMNNVLKEKISNNKDEILNVKNTVEKKEALLELQQEHVNKLQQNNTDLIDKKQQEIDATQSQIINLQRVGLELSEKVLSLQNSILDKEPTENTSKKLFQYETKIETNLSKHKKDKDFFCNNDSCPTCKQVIQEEFKREQIRNLEDKEDQLKKGLDQISLQIKSTQDRLKEINTVTKQIQDLQIQTASNSMSINQSMVYIQKLNKEIQSLKNDTKDIEKDETKLKMIQEEIRNLEETKKALIEDKNYLETASILLKDTGIKTKIIKQYLPVINKLVNKYLTSLDFFVNFNLDESFKETIKSRHRDEFSYASFSEGEKQRIDMALMLTWRAVAKLKNSSNTNLLILDEVFDSSLDTNGTEYLMQILHMLEDVNLFVISHKGDILQDKFRNMIRFEKVNNFSRIAE
jgi:DNA repair exonuclease SbcCD ATPase subunit